MSHEEGWEVGRGLRNRTKEDSRVGGMREGVDC